LEEGRTLFLNAHENGRGIKGFFLKKNKRGEKYKLGLTCSKLKLLQLNISKINKNKKVSVFCKRV
jgi:hypothetical protein